MPRRFMPKTSFEANLPGHETTVKDFITSYYGTNNTGPTQEEVRDGTGLDNDLVTYILKKLVQDGTDVIMIQG